MKTPLQHLNLGYDLKAFDNNKIQLSPYQCRLWGCTESDTTEAT